MVLLDKTIKETYSVDVAVSNSHTIHSAITKKFQKIYRLERTAYKNMGNENDLYDTAGTVHIRYQTKQTTRNIKSLNLRNCPHQLTDQTNHTKYKTAQSPELSTSGIRPN